MLTLVRWRIRIEIARYRSNAVMWVVYGVVGLVLVALMGWLARALFGVLVDEAPTFADAVLLATYAAIGAFQILAGIRWGISRLFLSSDVEFLLGAPLPVRNVFALKTFELVVASPVSTAVLASVTWGYAAAHGSLLAVPVALVAPLGVALLGVLPGELVTLVIARVFRSPRIRTIVSFVPFVLWGSFAVSGSSVGGVIEGVLDRDADFASLDATGRSMLAALRVLPTSWAADIARGAAQLHLGTLARGAVLLAAGVALLWVLTLGVFRSTFQTSWTQIASGASRTRARSFLDNLTGPLTGTLRAIVLKEWKTFARDTRLLTQSFFPVAFGGYLAYVSARDNAGTPRLSALILLVIAGPNIAAASLLGEQRNLNVLKAAPIRGRDVIVGKSIAYAAPAGVLAGIVGLVLGATGSVGVAGAVLIFVFGSWTIAWVMLFDVAIAAFWGRFDLERPRIPLPLGLLPGILSLGVAGAQGVVGIWLARVFGSDASALGQPLTGIPIVLVAGAICAGILSLATAAGRRLEAIEPP